MTRTLMPRLLLIFALNTSTDMRRSVTEHNVTLFRASTPPPFELTCVAVDSAGCEARRPRGFDRVEYVANDPVRLDTVKWTHALDALGVRALAAYDYVTLTNDSFVLLRALHDYFALARACFPTTQAMVGLLQSEQTAPHCVSFLRTFTRASVLAFRAYVDATDTRVHDVATNIRHFEVNASAQFETRALYYSDPAYAPNIHFDDRSIAHYVRARGYPLLKLKRVFATDADAYPPDALPPGFDPTAYAALNTDLPTSWNCEQIIAHWFEHGRVEGRAFTHRKHAFNRLCRELLREAGVNVDAWF